MNPFDVRDNALEHYHQTAIFSWLKMAYAYGVSCAEDPLSYRRGAQLRRYEWGNDLRGLALDCAYAVPNGLFLAPRWGAIAKSQGLNPGMPDMCIPWARSASEKALYIELKRVRSGKLSSEQKKKLDSLTSLGYKCIVSRGWRPTVNEIKDYMGF